MRPSPECERMVRAKSQLGYCGGKVRCRSTRENAKLFVAGMRLYEYRRIEGDRGEL
jgi:hypothetical protein